MQKSKRKIECKIVKATSLFLHFAFGFLNYRTSPSHSPTLRRPAAVVRNRRDVTNRLHLDAHRLERPDRRFAPRTGALDADVDGPETAGIRSVARVHRSLRGRERRSLAGPLEADAARARPGDHVPFRIGDRDLRVVERGVDVHQSMMDDAL